MTRDQQLEFYYWMCLTRIFDERMIALWKQGRGVGGRSASAATRRSA